MIRKNCKFWLTESTENNTANSQQSKAKYLAKILQPKNGA